VSPLAECLLRERLAALVETIDVSSAGTEAVPGTPMAATATSLVVGWSGDPSGMVARRLTAGLVESADLVLGAATEHREAAYDCPPCVHCPEPSACASSPGWLGPEDAAGVVDPVTRFAALVEGAAARRGRPALCQCRRSRSAVAPDGW
jgi:low molecular weight protein-tyrosine phosphatase